MKARKQFALLLLAFCALVGPARGNSFTLSCLDPNARPVYLEGTPGTHQCTITNASDQNVEQLVLGQFNGVAQSGAAITPNGGDGGDWAGFGGNGAATIDWGACARGIPAFNTRTKAVGQCTFTVNFITDEPVGETGPEDVDQSQWKLTVWVTATGVGNFAQDTANIVVGDAGTVPEPTSFALITMGGLLVLLPRVLAGIRSGLASYSSRSTRLARQAGTKQAASDPHTSSAAVPA